MHSFLCVLSFILIVLHTFSTLLRHVQKNNMNCPGISQVTFLFCCCFLVQTCLLLFPCYIDSILWKIKSLKWFLIIVKDLIWRKSGEMYLIIYTQKTKIFIVFKYRPRISGRENAFLIHLHLTREVLLYFSKITLNLKLTKLKQMIMTIFLE